MGIIIVDQKISKSQLQALAEERFGDMVKAVVDIERGTMAMGGELHADEEQVMLEQGSQQNNLWGINIYPQSPLDQRVEFDSMINIRPSQGNRSRSVEDPKIQAQILTIVQQLVE